MNNYNSNSELIKGEVSKVLYIASTVSLIALFITNLTPKRILDFNTKCILCLYHHIFALVCSIEILLGVD